MKAELNRLNQYSTDHREAALWLAELAGKLWSNLPIQEVVNNHQDFKKEVLQAGWIIEGSPNEYRFANEICFDYFYSLIYLQENFLRDKDVCRLCELLKLKIHREKSKNPIIKLSYQFYECCYINIHNFYQFDLVSFFLQTENLTSCYPDIQFHLQSSLPYFKTSSKLIYQLLRQLAQHEDEQLFGRMANSLSEFASHQPEPSVELLSLVEQDASEKVRRAISSLLIGISNSNSTDYILPILLKKLASDKEEQMMISLFVLSRITITPAEWKNHGSRLLDLIEQVERSGSDAVKLMLPEFYLQHITIVSNAKDRLVDYSMSDKPNVQAFMSHLLWLRSDEKGGEPWYETILINSSRWDFSIPAIINNMRFCLVGLVGNNPALVLRYLNSWIAYENNDIEKFIVFRNELTTLCGNHHVLARQWITQCFRNENDRFHVAMQNVISDLWTSGITNLTLDSDMLNSYSFYEVKYVLFKILGYIYSKEPLESLVWSILNRNPFDWEIAQLVANAFTGYICYNYGGTFKFMKSKYADASAEQAEFIDSILANNEEYNKYIRPIHTIQELKWQNKQGISFVRQKMKQMSKDFKKGLDSIEEGSIRSLFTNISLKGGRGFFSKYEGRYTPVTELKNMGSSFELPAGEFIDPVKQILMKIEWRKYQIQS